MSSLRILFLKLCWKKSENLEKAWFSGRLGSLIQTNPRHEREQRKKHQEGMDLRVWKGYCQPK